MVVLLATLHKFNVIRCSRKEMHLVMYVSGVYGLCMCICAVVYVYVLVCVLVFAYVSAHVYACMFVCVCVLQMNTHLAHIAGKTSLTSL